MIPQRPATRRIDLGSLAILPAGIAIVLLAQVLEGGTVRSLLQGPAALIVFGGTAAALLISYSLKDVRKALVAAARTFVKAPDDARALSSQIIGFSARAHRRGALALEADVDTVEDPFFRTGLGLVVDGVPTHHLKEALGVARSASVADDEAPARIFEAAAGYSPTFGILGAVVGLIQVMEHLNQPSALGSGIAVAFVATVYGVGAANLIFLPVAGRLREHADAADHRRELIVEGLLALHHRLNPRLVVERLRVFTEDSDQTSGVPRVSSAASRVQVSA